ncbi:IclR family transcriptional regulator [Actinomadura rayongensis]|uniref:Glycerol operon regulatory protein n=1 Tax=Actinomadura rayongensis TaxID=1429076 RepID=A0A6I4WF75_9ACTN|nr:IclR family transcriptional regulator [Actinomadura rayongensis]MXQ67540.1 helix-turn-helix domain-containing protein [Actinomadura rayongensis]
MAGRSNGQSQGIQSVEVAMRALEALENLGGPAPLTGVANEAGMSPSTAHRYLVSLIRVGLVVQDVSTGWYDLGPAARRLGLEAMRRADDVGIATRYAAELRNATGHAVNVTVWADNGPTIVRWEYGRHPLPIIARVGSTLPLVDSSVGRVFLAYMPTSITQPVLETQQRYKESSALRDEELSAIVRQVRAEGIAETQGAVLPGLRVLAAPVFGPGGLLAVVIASTVLARLARPEVLASVAEHLRDATDRISVELGGPTAAQWSALPEPAAD